MGHAVKKGIGPLLSCNSSATLTTGCHGQRVAIRIISAKSISACSLLGFINLADNEPCEGLQASKKSYFSIFYKMAAVLSAVANCKTSIRIMKSASVMEGKHV